MSLDILFVAWNRLEYTRAAFEALLANTDWDQIRQLRVHDDRSTDGTSRYLEDAIEQVPASVDVRFESIGLSSPVLVMNRYLAGGPADWFVKLDNDCAVPPGWLDPLLAVRDTNPDADLIGMEAGMTAVANRNEPWDGTYRLQECTHIGGVGLMRSAAFRKPMRAHGRYGFGDFQVQQNLNRGWVTPDLPLVLLDRLPFEPWLSLSEFYVAAGWQRPWGKWNEWMSWAWEWFAPEAVVAA